MTGSRSKKNKVKQRKTFLMKWKLLIRNNNNEKKKEIISAKIIKEMQRKERKHKEKTNGK